LDARGSTGQELAGRSEGVRVAFLLNKFPLLSETFVLNQVTGLIDRGCALDIYVRGPLAEEKTHADIARYGLEAVDLYQDRLPGERRTELLRMVVGTALRHGFSDARLLGACLRLVRPQKIHEALVHLYPAAEMLRRGPYDIVHAHYGINGNWAASLRALGAFRGKIVVTFHDGFDLSTYVAQHGSDVYAPTFRDADLILPISDAVRNRLIELGCSAEKASVHRVGVDLSRFPSRPADQHGGPTRITTVARLVEMKGIEYGIEAAARLAAQGLDVEYEIAGDGELRGDLQAQIDRLGVGERVRLLGWRDMTEIERLLSATDIFLAPSVTDRNGSQEGIPTALMEAMAARIPVVSTAYSGIPELIRDGVDGYLNAERDVEAITDRLALLARDPERRRSMAEQGRRRVEELHDIERLNDRLLERYRGLIES